jgi:para-nitrobenzyl esterase
MMSLKITIYLCFLAFLVETSHGQVCAPDNVNNTLLTTLNGRVQGSCSNVLIPYLGYYMTDVVTWFSVPYAEPPIDANRFKAPAPVQSWSSIRNGVTLPKTCLQSGQQIRLETSEDCLYLNIYATANAFKNRATSQKPILVFIHGGSL